MSVLILVLSPHLDDAVYSCTDHILNWKKKYDIEVVSFFTKSIGSKITSRDAFKFVELSGFVNVDEFEFFRKKEDEKAMRCLNLNHTYLDFVDAAFRSYKRMPVYSSFEEIFSGKISKKDFYLINKSYLFIESYLNFKLKNYSEIVVVSPFGIGSHVDHLIVRNVSNKIIQNYHNVKVFHYLESPYISRIECWGNPLIIGKMLFSNRSIIFPSKEKYKIMKIYKSQTNLIFKDKVIFPELILGEEKVIL